MYTTNNENQLQNMFRKVMENYAVILEAVKTKNDFKNEFRNIIAYDIPELLRHKVRMESHYKIVGSYGKGRWTDVPWIAVLDDRITTSARNGVYIVYIFNKDSKELFITLNQGVTAVVQNGITGVEATSKFTSITKNKNEDIKEQLRKEAVFIRKQLNIENTLEVQCGLELYDVGCIYAKRYTLSDLPEDKELIADLNYFVELYRRYYNLFIENKRLYDNVEDNEEVCNESETNVDIFNEKYEPYGKKDFLRDVFMSEDDYDLLSELLLTKKNIILQGAPGVGKTYMAKRLAYSLLGCKDTKRVLMVQFHQSYSYEDFIVGYRPNETGFELQYGPFYEFCKMAESDDKPHFFIIDEINRGNVSKIFGELLMLIENDKRDESLKLLYTKEQFSVPANVHIIGMMNTADRSLAIIDYALRRRFAFYDVAPAFDNMSFVKMVSDKESEKLNRLISYVKQLNDDIRNDESLGKGFEVGHSYFCTSPDTNIDKKWIKSTVEYEIIPLINEYWFDDRDKVDEWSSKLRGVEND